MSMSAAIVREPLFNVILDEKLGGSDSGPELPAELSGWSIFGTLDINFWAPLCLVRDVYMQNEDGILIAQGGQYLLPADLAKMSGDALIDGDQTCRLQLYRCVHVHLLRYMQVVTCLFIQRQ